MDKEVSNETDLDWLARNVHKWPESTPHIIPAGDCVFEFGATFCENHVCLYHREFADSKVIHKHQWLALRAELQNKQNWKDAPEWAKWLCQNSAGEWHWICADTTPTPRLRAWCADNLNFEFCGGQGEVLGDWRDTLEKRPEEFKPFTSIEDNQGQDMTQQHDMKQDSGWFERGELPPVGKVCLYVVSDRLSAEVEITAHAKFGLCFVMVGTSGESYVSKTAELYRFRPIITEREKQVDELESLLRMTSASTLDHLDVIAAAIYAAGFRKESK